MSHMFWNYVATFFLTHAAIRTNTVSLTYRTNNINRSQRDGIVNKAFNNWWPQSYLMNFLCGSSFMAFFGLFRA